MESGMDLVVTMGVSGLLVVITVFIHAMALWVVRLYLFRRIRGRSYNEHVFQESLLISATVMALCAAHLMEIASWAAGYMALHAVPNLQDSFYFSITTYTTVGPVGVTIDPHYRSVAGFESLLGPMMIAWSTAFLVEFVGRMRSPQAR